MGILSSKRFNEILVESSFKNYESFIETGTYNGRSIIPLANKGAIRLTISKYYLPSGESISEIGVSPDIFIEEEGEEFAINTDTDNQLNYAINLFSG